MQLTRRDVAAALAALGASGAVALGAGSFESSEAAAGDDGPPAEDLADDVLVRDTMVAVAEVVYPSEVEGVEAFVEGVLAGRLDREGHAAGLREAVADLDGLAMAWYDAPAADLSVDDRASLLDETGADTAEAVPAEHHVEGAGGTAAERIRYYVVNDLLLALYASPTGGELVGIENPQGHPGGIQSYQRGPNG